MKLNSSSDDTKFSFIRNILWPIRKKELSYFLPFSLLATLIMFNYTILHNIKDTLILSHIGANAIPFLKLYFTTPMAFGLIILFTKLSISYNRKKMFYIFIIPFVLFFGIYAFFIYPNIQFINPSIEKVARLKNIYPNLTSLIDIYSNWTLAFVFVLCELWQVIMLSVLFWQFANSTIKKEDAKRFYTMFVVFINTSAIVVGGFIRMQEKILGLLSIAYTWTNVFKMQISLFLIISGFIVIIYKKICKSIENEANADCFQNDAINNINKIEPVSVEKRSLKYNFKLILQSRHLILLALLLIFYGIAINFIDIQWKAAVVQHFKHHKKEMNLFFTKQSMYISLFSVLFTWIVASGLLRNIKWITRSLLTPVIMLVMGSFVFIKVIYSDHSEFAAKYIVNIGFYAIMFLKISKYAFFDTSKEMAFIPLANNMKLNGKAAVEIIGGRLGKSLSSLIQTMLLIIMSTNSMMDISAILYIIFLFICSIWLVCVKDLNYIIKNELN